MKKLLILFFILSYSLHSQYLSLFDIDTTSFPTIKAKFYAFDKDGNQIINLSPSDLFLSENGISRTITKISCSNNNAVPLSTVLVFDISGSMRLGPPRIESAKQAAYAWIDGLDSYKSECALVSFSDESFILHDFTKDKEILKNSISKLTPTNGTNYNQALLDMPCGGLNLAKDGYFKKVIVFLTDGLPNSEPKTSEIIKFAKANNIMIFAVTLDMPAPKCIKDMTKQTGGQYFEDITTLQEAKGIYQKMLQIAQEGKPCEIEWESGLTCVEGLISVNCRIKNLEIESKTAYQSPKAAFASLEISPNQIKFRNVQVGTERDTTITIKALYSDFIISNINSSNSLFEISPKSFKLKKGDTLQLKISYKPTDSLFSYTKFEFENDICMSFFYVSGTFTRYKLTPNSAKLTHPNGGEVFVAGSDTIITWKGILPTDSVRLELSADNGRNWKTITTSATGLSYNWQNIPKPESNECLVKFIQKGNISSQVLMTLSGHSRAISSTCWSPDGNKLASSSSDSTIKIWDANSGQIIKTLLGHSDWVSGISWSPDGNKLASSSGDSTIKIWDATTGQIINTMKGHIDWVSGVSWSPNGNKLSSSSGDGTVKIWDATTGQILRTLYIGQVMCVGWSPDGSKLVSGSKDKSIKIWDATTGQLINTFLGHSDLINSVSWSPNGNEILSKSNDRTLRIWDIASGQLIKTFNNIYFTLISNISWNPDASKIAVSNLLGFMIINLLTDQVFSSSMSHKDIVYCVSWSPDGSKIASGDDGGNIIIWEIDSDDNQSDVSDSVFSIVEPIPDAENIDMGKVLVGSAKDSVVTNFTKNIGSYKFRVDSIYFTGADAPAFSLVSGLPQYSIEPNNSHYAEFHFAPTEARPYNANVVIITQCDTLLRTITGEGVEPVFQVFTGILDFGKVELGFDKVIQDTVLLTNISPQPISITNTLLMTPDIEQFNIISGGGAFTLNPGEVRKLTLQFKPKYGGRTSGRLGFEYNGVGSPATVQLFGTGIGGLVTTNIDSAYAGDKWNLQLKLENIKPDGLQFLATQFSADISFQSTITIPEDNSLITNQTLDTTTITIRGPIPNSNIFASIPMIAGLGNVEETDLLITNFKLYDAIGSEVEYDVDYNFGKFKLLGICKDGGARLINPSGKAGIQSIAPNPAGNSIDLEFNTSEIGYTEIVIYNTLGEKVLTAFSEDISETGKRNIKINSGEVGNGTYMVIFKSLTVVDTKQIMIVK